MKAVAEKEKKGRLDPNAEPYESVSKEEQELLNKVTSVKVVEIRV